MSDDLAKRLRAIGGVRHDGATQWYINPDGPEAADRIEKLEAALKPFAELGEAWLPVDGDDSSIWVTSPDTTPVNNLSGFGFTFGHFRAAARAALAGEKKDE